MQLELLPQLLSVCRLQPESVIPDWSRRGVFFSITRTPDELSIVCEQKDVPANVTAEKNWRVFKVKGHLEFSLTGVLLSLAAPLAEAEISIFAVSTFDTDYLLVKGDSIREAIEVLTRAGHAVTK